MPPAALPSDQNTAASFSSSFNLCLLLASWMCSFKSIYIPIVITRSCTVNIPSVWPLLLMPAPPHCLHWRVALVNLQLSPLSFAETVVLSPVCRFVCQPFSWIVQKKSRLNVTVIKTGLAPYRWCVATVLSVCRRYIKNYKMFPSCIAPPKSPPAPDNNTNNRVTKLFYQCLQEFLLWYGLMPSLHGVPLNFYLIFIYWTFTVFAPTSFCCTHVPLINHVWVLKPSGLDMTIPTTARLTCYELERLFQITVWVKGQWKQIHCYTENCTLVRNRFCKRSRSGWSRHILIG